MLFIFLFAIAGLAVQIAFEVKKSGRDNLLVRSGEQIKTLKALKWLERIFERVSSTMASLISLSFLMITIAIIFKITAFLLNLLR